MATAPSTQPRPEGAAAENLRTHQRHVEQLLAGVLQALERIEASIDGYLK